MHDSAYSNPGKWEAVAAIPSAPPAPELSGQTYEWEDGVQCRVCGFVGVVLSSHISRKHGLLKEQYRKEYGSDAPYFVGEVLGGLIEQAIVRSNTPQARWRLSQMSKKCWRDNGEAILEARRLAAEANGKKYRPAREMACEVCDKAFMASQSGWKRHCCSTACAAARMVGGASHRAKLRDDQREEIRAIYARNREGRGHQNGSATQAALALKYGVSQSTISHITMCMVGGYGRPAKPVRQPAAGATKKCR